MATRYWCEMAWLGGDTVEAGVVIDVAGDRIMAITSDVAHPPPDAIRLAGITLPCLANAHSHAFHRALRGRSHHGPGTFWSWRDLMYGVAARLDPDNYFQLARATFAEMALAGIGVVGEFHYVHHRPDGKLYDDPNAMGSALVAAASEAGIRLTLLDTLYLHGGLTGDDKPSDPYLDLGPEQRRFGDGNAGAWAERTEVLRSSALDSMVNIGAAVHSVRAVDPESMTVVRAWCNDHEAPLHGHVSEQPAENDQCLARFGCTPIELFDANGLLGPSTTVIHATYASERDIDRLSSSGTGCCLCPTTERDLADGIGPSGGLVSAGVPLSLGSDSHAMIDLFEEARAVELNQRLITGRRGVHPLVELAQMATVSGYQALGWPDGGRLAVDGLADFSTIGLDSVRLAGTNRCSALAAVVFAAGASDVRHLVVGGKVVVSEGRHVTIDVPEAMADAVRAVTTP